MFMASSLEQLKNFTNDISSVKGEFSQQLLKINDRKSEYVDVSSGVFLFRKPNKLIWNYQRPYSQILQTDGNKLYIYDRDLRQVTIKTLGDELNSSPLGIIFSSNFSSKKLILKNGGCKDDLAWIEILPKNKGIDNNFDYIAIGLHNSLPKIMKLRDLFGQVSLLKFKKIIKNPVLSTRALQFLLPKNVDIFNLN